MHPNNPLMTLNLSGLTDVGPRGKASQSSTSRWSRPDDAQRAVKNVSSEFAFHTDTSPDAWWMLDLKRVYFPTLIVISNRRRKQFWHLAKNISVSVSENGNDWKVLHQGELHFGTLEEGLPLTLPLQGLTEVRYIKIENGSRYLHLSSVQVYVESFTELEKSGLVFVSNRTDGLGERLKALVNSIALARYFKGDFGFSWQAISSSVSVNHATGTPSDIFSENFLNAHLTEVKEGVPLRSFLTAERKGRLPEGNHVLTPQTSIYNSSPAPRTFITPEDLSNSFWSIDFSEKMTRAIHAAQSVPIKGNGIGLHMRAGDIIYGRYRFNNRYANKVVPYPLSVAFIESERTRGNNVILFGQDYELCRSISAAHSAIFAGDYHSQFEFDDHQAAIFDIVLMSRCAKVVAGNSGFSQIAQLVGRFEMLDPQDILPQDEACSALRRFLAGDVDNYLAASDLQQAFCRVYFVTFYADYLSSGDIETMLREALTLDPGNSFYACVLAVQLFRSGKSADAEEVLDYLVSSEFPVVTFGSLPAIIQTRHPDGTLALEKYRPQIRAMADSKMNVAVGIHALLCRLSNDEDAFQSYLAMYRFGSSGKTTSLDLALEQHARRSIE